MVDEIERNTICPTDRLMENFHIDLTAPPPASRICYRRDQDLKEHCVAVEIVSPEQIFNYGQDQSERLCKEIDGVIRQAFPNMVGPLLEAFVGFGFRRPERGFHRHVVLFRESSGRLVGTTIFDYGPVVCQEQCLSSIYILFRAFIPEYQNDSLGQLIAAKILSEHAPDLLLTTANQSASLHSWLGLVEKSLVSDYEVYPRMEKHGKEDRLVTIPHKEVEFYIEAFKQAYWNVYEEGDLKLALALRNLTPQMVRKNLHDGIYDFHPWKKAEKTDQIAEALGLTDRDGIVVILKKRLFGR